MNLRILLVYAGENCVGLDGYLGLAVNNWKHFQSLTITQFEPIRTLFLASTPWPENFSVGWDLIYKKIEKDIVRIHEKIFIRN